MATSRTKGQAMVYVAISDKIIWVVISCSRTGNISTPKYTNLCCMLGPGNPRVWQIRTLGPEAHLKRPYVYTLVGSQGCLQMTIACGNPGQCSRKGSITILPGASDVFSMFARSVLGWPI